MKKTLMALAMLLTVAVAAQAQARMSFEKTTHDFGKFASKNPIQTCTFTFTNKGDKPLVISQAVASCGCTVPTYTKKPIMPGKTGVVSVKYNGEGKFPGHFKKSITVRTNGSPELQRLYIEGEMTE